ncbi:MAG: NUDIX domain-containing protein [Patescibacteria group bacterium]
MNEGSGAFLLFSNGLVGLQLKDNLDYLSDKWCVSAFGGGFEQGEDQLTCLKRELYEELQIKNVADSQIVKVGDYEAKLKENQIVLAHQFIIVGLDMNLLKPSEGNLCIIDPNSNINGENLRIGEIAEHYYYDTIKMCISLHKKYILNGSYK